MTDPRAIYRLGDIVNAIEKIDLLIGRSGFDELHGDPIARAAFERFLEILSEASRHIDDELKSAEPDIPWRSIAGIGNHLRHAYHRVDFEILWNLHENGDLAALNMAVLRMIEHIQKD